MLGAPMTAKEAGPDVEFSLVVLCYGAGLDAVPFVESIHRNLELLAVPWELVLVGNHWPGRADPTPAVVRELAGRLPRTRALTLEKQGGMGWDMRTGLAVCRGRYLGVIDGDGQFPVDSVLAALARMRAGGFDLVKTWRVARRDGVYRRFVSRVYNGLFRILFPAYEGNDVNSKPKLLTRELYRDLDLQSDGWFIDAEIVLGSLERRARISEVPIEFAALETRPSFVRAPAVLEFLSQLFAYRFGTRARGTPCPPSS